MNKYEKTNLPLIIENIPEHEGWNAVNQWSLEQLRAKYTNLRMRCGDDDDGYTLKVVCGCICGCKYCKTRNNLSFEVKLKYFCKYMESNNDDSPLKIFDGSFDEDPLVLVL